MIDRVPPLRTQVPRPREQRPLKHVCRFSYGDALKSEVRRDGPFRVYGSNGPIGNHDQSNTVSPCLVIGRKGSFGKVTFSSDPAFVIDTAYFVDPNHTQEDIRWLYYVLSCAGLDAVSKDSAVPGLARQDAYARTVPWCTRHEQEAISSYLQWYDTQTALVIRNKRRLIALLNEEKQAIIQQAVTRGLDPDVPMKPSGVEWLGEIPAHWELLPFLRCVSERADYRGATPEKVDAGVQLITAKNIRNGWIDYESSKEFVRTDEYHKIMRRGLPTTGDILFTMEAPLGNAALVDREDIALAQRVIRFRMDEQKMLPEFALFSLLSPYFQTQLQLRATGSTASGLKASKLPQLLVACPPVEEQRQVVQRLEADQIGIDQAVQRIQQEIDLIREYRTRLIADVVTGQLDVREAAAALPDIEDAEVDSLLTDADDLELAEGDDLPDEDLDLSESADAAD